MFTNKVNMQFLTRTNKKNDLTRTFFNEVNKERQFKLNHVSNVRFFSLLQRRHAKCTNALINLAVSMILKTPAMSLAGNACTPS